MAYQNQTEAVVAIKAQSAKGTQATGGSGTVVRLIGGSGIGFGKNPVESQEVRRDAQNTRGRHGMQTLTAAYDTELTLGGAHDLILPALFRSSWGTADLAVTSGDFTTTTTTTSTIVFASGSPISLGFRVGDVIRCSGLTATANNSRNLRITGLSATTITVAETLTLDASADSGGTITRPGRVCTNPAAGSLAQTYFTLDEHEYTVDGSRVATDFIWGSATYSMTPNGLVMFNPSGIGTGAFEALTGASAPLLTSPTATTGSPMACVDATLRLGSTDEVAITAFDIGIDITPSAPEVVASNVSPDVFPGTFQVNMNITMLREDMAEIAAYVDETVLSFHALFIENETAPEDFVSLYVPNFTLGGVDLSALSKAGGGRTQTLSIPAGLVGIDETGGAYDATTLKVQTSTSS